ncbi:hypothetical protein SPRG_20271 [Saprolegnia parasitica CBS 223.65]|uniref:Uncharacterized protein n=1 Tax=Saprolegnia parasitica (strain CBS 223.65) TaxID=695850 RepID=A0A067CBH9_SAPPC|nr:hypothetical protein SPRG_20271 [Saprolegnia parasitica CBS 223.65]KDO28114.1 hypothetical protein SPRG_20271 [Saprolegnia parasitica CBS 223.65]|eukprot:XP_012201254.1 hypothetical protein SPRG_20271 [Saprolegnia parasitica CBS 223.65]
MDAMCREHSRGRRVALGLFIGLTLLVGLLLILVLSNVFAMPSTTRDSYIEVCIQVLNATLTLAALMVHPARFVTLLRLLMWYASSTDMRAEARIQAAFPSLPVEFMDQNNPQGINVPMRKLACLMGVLNLQCFLQYPITAVVWLYPFSERPYFVIALALALSCTCTIGAALWEHRMHRSTVRYRAKRAESAIERFLVEDTSI